jgi:hypothetical protein
VEHASLQGELLRLLVLQVRPLHGLEVLADGLLAQVVLADDPQRHVQALTGDVVEEVQSIRIPHFALNRRYSRGV